MAVRDWITRTFGAKASIIGLSADELPDRALEKSFDDASLLSTYADDAWPYIVANKVGEQASQAPIQVGRVTLSNGKEQFEPVGPGHPVQLLFDRPNPQMEGGEFVHLLTLYMGMTGHAPIEFVGPGPGSRLGAPGRPGRRVRDGFELWLHNPGPWRIVANPDGTVRGYLWVSTSESDIRWTPDQMTYLRWPNPNDRWYGQGHISAVRQQVMAEEYASIRDKKFEKQLGVPPGILSSEMPLGDPQAKELQRRWEQAVGGYQNAGKIAVLGSKTTYQPVAVNSRDAEWLAQRRDRVEIICAAWGVPLPLVRMQDAKFANAQEARAEFWEGTLGPRLNRIGRMLTQRLIPLITTEPLEVRFDLAKIEALGENDLEAAQTAKAWTDTGSVTVNEVRARLGLDAHPDAKLGERIIVPSSITLKDPAEIDEEPEPAAMREPEDDAPPRPRKATKADESDESELLLDSIREAFQRDLGSFFAAQLGALHGLTGKALPVDDGQSLLERAIEILSAKRWQDRLARIAEPPIRSSITLGATRAATKLGVGVSFSIPASERAIQLLTGHLETLGVGIKNTTLADVKRVLTETLRGGYSAAETRAIMRQKLDETFQGYEDWRLDRIARTETRAAYNLGSLGQYRDAGVTMVTVVDGELDGNCEPWNGKYTTLEDAESAPLGHPNCRRDFIPDTSGLGRGRSGSAEPENRPGPRGPDFLDAAALALIVDEVFGRMAARSDRQELHVHIPEAVVAGLPAPVVNVEPPVVNVAAPIVNVPAPIVNVEAQPAPIVNVAPPDMKGVAAEIGALRSAMTDLKAEVRRPRTKKLVRDDLGRVIGSTEEAS